MNQKEPAPYYVYLLRCKDGSLYTGITTDPARRLKEHAAGRSGKGAKYTSAHEAVRLEAAWKVKNRSEASRLEYRIKKLSRAEKESLLCDSSAMDALLAKSQPKTDN